MRAFRSIFNHPLPSIGDSRAFFGHHNLLRERKISVGSIFTTRSMSSSGPIYTAGYLKDKLIKELKAEHVDIEDLSNCGCGMKFDATIVSPEFEGKSILQRQRLVNQTLSGEMKHIHAFTMRTLTPGQWNESGAKNRPNQD